VILPWPCCEAPNKGFSLELVYGLGIMPLLMRALIMLGKAPSMSMSCHA